MAIIRIKQGDTLSGLAQQYKTNIEELMRLNPNIANPNFISAGANLNVPDIQQLISQPILSAGQSAIATKPIQPTSQPVPIQPISITTSNPALQQLFTSANQLIADYHAKGGKFTPEMAERVRLINEAEIQKMSLTAKARTAADNKDAVVLNESLTAAKTAEKNQQDEIDTLLADLKTARTTFIESIKPTQAESDLRTKLNTLRTERQLLPLELRQEGISVIGIQARQVDDERVRAIQEQNLLLEIGLKQEARQFETAVKEKQISFIKDDIAIQQKIQDRLDQKEKDTLAEARNLRKDALAAMSDILTSFKGLAWSDLDAESQVDLMDTSKQFNIPLNLLTKAMENTKQQQIFENAIKLAKTGPMPTKITAENYEQVKSEAVELFTATDNRQYIQDPNNLNVSIPNPNYGKKLPALEVYEAIIDRIPIEKKDDFQKWVKDMGYLTDEELRGVGIPVKTEPKFNFESYLDSVLTDEFVERTMKFREKILMSPARYNQKIADKKRELKKSYLDTIEQQKKWD